MWGVMLASDFLVPPTLAEQSVAVILILMAASALATAYGCMPGVTGMQGVGMGAPPWAIAGALAIVAIMKPAWANPILKICLTAIGLYDTLLVGLLLGLSQ